MRRLGTPQRRQTGYSSSSTTGTTNTGTATTAAARRRFERLLQRCVARRRGELCDNGVYVRVEMAGDHARRVRRLQRVETTTPFKCRMRCAKRGRRRDSSGKALRRVVSVWRRFAALVADSGAVTDGRQV
jgi:hypothetical protein